jgi:hypothetical protein
MRAFAYGARLWGSRVPAWLLMALAVQLRRAGAPPRVWFAVLDGALAWSRRFYPGPRP